MGRVVFCALLGLACLALLPDRVGAQSSAQDWFQRGVALSRGAQWSDARTAYLRSIELEPRVSTYFNLATASLKLQLGRATLLALNDFEQRADQREHAEFLAEAAHMRAEALDLTGTVILTGLLVDATVEVDHEGTRWPTEPTHRISLDPGHHVLTLRAPSHVPSSLPVDVTRGVSTQLSATWTAVKPVAPASAQAPQESSVHPAWLWGGIAAVGVGTLVTVLVLSLGSSGEKAPASGGSLDMVL